MANEIWNGDGDDNAIATDANWISNDAPDTGDSACFPAMAADSTNNVDGSDFSAVLLADFIVEAGNYLTFGSRDAYLQLDCDYFEFTGAGAHAYFDVDNCAELRILNSVSPASGHSYGVNLVGTTNTLLLINDAGSGTIGIGALQGESATFTTINVQSGTVTLGDGITNTTFHANGGVITSFSDSTTLNVNGAVFTQAKNKPTTLNLFQGRFYFDDAQTIGTCNLYGGTLDLSHDGRAKTITTLNWYGGTIYDPNNVLTLTNAPSTKNGGTWSRS